jgi:hypothetical protein
LIGVSFYPKEYFNDICANVPKDEDNAWMAVTTICTEEFVLLFRAKTMQVLPISPVFGLGIRLSLIRDQNKFIGKTGREILCSSKTRS